MSPGKLVLIIGPSGVGKSVILKKLRERHPEFHFPKSATTRARRTGEGGDLYHFVTDETFDHMLADGKMLESAVVHGRPSDEPRKETVKEGARYGTLVQEIIPSIEAGKTVVREVDVQGFESIKHHSLFQNPTAHHRLLSIFILPENREQLIARITLRAPIAEDELARRVESMDRELEYARLCDVQIMNKEGALKDTIAAVESILEQ